MNNQIEKTNTFELIDSRIVNTKAALIHASLTNKMQTSVHLKPGDKRIECYPDGTIQVMNGDTDYVYNGTDIFDAVVSFQRMTGDQ